MPVAAVLIDYKAQSAGFGASGNEVTVDEGSEDLRV